MIETITDKGKTLAIIIFSDYVAEGIEFFTPDDYPQQLGYMNHPKGYVIKPHVHNQSVREILFSQEVLFIKSGQVRIDFYDDSKKYIESRLLGEKDVVLLASGGHGLEMLDNSEIIEVKQGPFAGALDKVRFEPVLKNNLVVKSLTGHG